MCSSLKGEPKATKTMIVGRPVACVYSDATFRSEMVTQELIGRQVDIEASRDGWVKCRLSDGYSGWIPGSALFEDSNFKPTHLVAKRFARVTLQDRNTMLLPLGGYLEVVSAEQSKFWIRLPGQAMGSGSSEDFKPISSLPYRSSGLRRIVKEVVGTTYLWGGKSTFGFDCSGLVQLVYELLGTKLPRDSYKQAEVGQAVSSIAMVEPFDLFFFGTSEKIEHVAIHLGDLEILHASGFVRIESLKPDDPRFRKDLAEKIVCIRRLRFD